MFAYCLNNPASYMDSTGHCSCTISTRLDSYFEFAAVCLCGGGYRYPIYPYVAASPEEQISGMVNGQGNLPYSDTSIGLGTYGKSGCAYIAIYNACQLIGMPRSLSDITRDVFWSHGTLFFGAGGVAPWSMESYFAANGIVTKGSYSYESLTADIVEGDVIVFTVLNNRNNIFKGWHAMTALYTGGNYLVFNQYNNSTTYRSYSALDEAFSKGVWIYGMRIR